MYFRQERRAVERTWLNGGGLLTIAGLRGVYSCGVRDLSRDGAGLRLNGLVLLPIGFGLSLNGLRSVAAVELIWRDGDFAGIAFRPPSGRFKGAESSDERASAIMGP
jgi:hypothetical protein